MLSSRDARITYICAYKQQMCKCINRTRHIFSAKCDMFGCHPANIALGCCISARNAKLCMYICVVDIQTNIPFTCTAQPEQKKTRTRTRKLALIYASYTMLHVQRVLVIRLFYTLQRPSVAIAWRGWIVKLDLSQTVRRRVTMARLLMRLATRDEPNFVWHLPQISTLAHSSATFMYIIWMGSFSTISARRGRRSNFTTQRHDDFNLVSIHSFYFFFCGTRESVSRFSIVADWYLCIGLHWNEIFCVHSQSV